MNTKELSGKTVAITGSTGGIGSALCEHLALLGADLILMDRNIEKSQKLGELIKSKHSNISVQYITLDLEDIYSVKAATDKLIKMTFDVIIHNAGAYKIPRRICKTGLDNIFQINFASPYYITKELMSVLKARNGKVVAVGSIAHNYSKTDPSDPDFKERKRHSRVYGNSKRFLMFSLYELFGNDGGLAVTHPGITLTNITSHYPKLIFNIIKYPMKIIFMSPKKASLSILEGVFEDTGKNEWIGPRFFNIWGKPKKQKLSTCSSEESKRIFKTAEDFYTNLKNMSE